MIPGSDIGKGLRFEEALLCWKPLSLVEEKPEHLCNVLVIFYRYFQLWLMPTFLKMQICKGDCPCRSEADFKIIYVIQN